MSVLSSKVLTVAGLALLLWIVPSVGTQGHGSRGEAITHVDRAVVGQDVRAVAVLQSADRVVTHAVIDR